MQRDMGENGEDINGLHEIKALAESIKNISESAFALYKPIVEDICFRKTVSEKDLGIILDGLLSVCISDKILDLFKQVGRRFYNLYPEIIADYTMFYKEMYGEEEGELMSYDIYLKDPVTGTTAEVPGHLMRGGTFKADYHPESGTFTPALNTEAHLNITYNYGKYYSEIYKEEGIRTIYGMSGVDSISALEKIISFLDKKYKEKGKWVTTKRSKTVYYDKDGKEIDIIDAIMHKITPERKEEIEFEVSEGDTSDYWLDTAANAIRPLYQLIALAKMRPECIWDGD